MEAGNVYLNYASLKLSPLPGMEGRDLLQITELATNPFFQNEGEATRLMQDVCRRADMSNFILVLTPEPFGRKPLSAEQLEKWYSKFGFDRIQDKPVLMCREPKRKVWNIDTDEVVEVGGH